MAFRANEAAASAYEKAKRYLIPRDLNPNSRDEALSVLEMLSDKLGPVVDSYPTWHPLIWKNEAASPATIPSQRSGYEGLDHTVFFAHGFISCPYDDGKKIIKSVEELNRHNDAYLTAESLEVEFYNSGTNAIVVHCNWNCLLEADLTIPKSMAVPLMIENELPARRWASFPESWESMRGYLLGEPHGNRSSLFVNQATALAIKKTYQCLCESGMFGGKTTSPY